MTQDEFIAFMKPGAVTAYRTYGLWPSIQIAQGALESGWGKYAPGYNLFGITWFEGCGYESQEVMTAAGTMLFKKYNSYSESINDHLQLMLVPRYENVLKAKDYKEAAQALQNAGYAGDEQTYAAALIAVVEGSNLQMIDDMVRPYSYSEEEKAIAYLTARGSLSDPERAKQALSFWVGFHYYIVKWANDLRRMEEV